MKPGSVPTGRIGPLLADLIAERWPYTDGCIALGEKTGCNGDGIRQMIAQRNEGVEFDLVDKLFCALGRPDVWQGELKDVYDAVEFVQRCAVPSCSKTFPEQKTGAYVKRYCSPKCATLGHGIREGRCTGERLRQRGKCMKGHKLTNDNVYITKRDGYDERNCRTCQREYQREWTRKRRQSPEFLEKKRAAQRKWREAAV